MSGFIYILHFNLYGICCRRRDDARRVTGSQCRFGLCCTRQTLSLFIKRWLWIFCFSVSFKLYRNDWFLCRFRCNGENDIGHILYWWMVQCKVRMLQHSCIAISRIFVFGCVVRCVDNIFSLRSLLSKPIFCFAAHCMCATRNKSPRFSYLTLIITNHLHILWNRFYASECTDERDFNERSIQKLIRIIFHTRAYIPNAHTGLAFI